MKNKSLQQRILLICLLLVVSTLILSVVTIITVREKMIRDLDVNNALMLNIAYDQINNAIEKPLVQLEGLTSFFEKDKIIDDTLVTSYLLAIENAFDHFTRVSILSPEGNVEYTIPFDERLINTDASYENIFINKQDHKWFFSNAYKSSLSGESIVGASYDSGSFVILVEMNLEKLPIRVKDNHFYDENFNVEVLDKWGTYVISENSMAVVKICHTVVFDQIKRGVSKP